MKKPEFLKKVKHVHFVGIKGVGMTALACCAQDLNIKVSGSDIK
jgi:UDP-N-acetylmuramate-alanine ligase